MAEVKDFPRSTVVVLLVLAIIVSLLGSLTLYTQVKVVDSTDSSASNGQVKLNILSDKVLPESAQSGATGHVSLVIISQEG